ncbi:MAG TPA: M23 family metallopeptidase [Leptospiraceae bacterium]|nr:M23 family metallopeptidase [Leptospirales bacterium]HMX57966.1 M23 family metallopeptidase [Leptospiraceae bacterium]HMY44071.1 M23 family metallopeptidase [Leptospiraceae bacterium]HMZ38375.1 M23 family metallopeptidase [Leptospiraceae bacterium]HNE24046.1 M23 family metallopeptidase [Leptospiraceae bacterium]
MDKRRFEHRAFAALKVATLATVILCNPLSRSLSAEPSCAIGMGTVCVDAVQRGETVTFTAQNRETYEVTITINGNLKNMTSSMRLPYSRTLPGKFNGPILTWKANPRGAWSWTYTFNWTPGSLEGRHDSSVVYDLPFHGAHKIVQGFHGSFSHTGDFEYAVDWEMPVGTSVFAAREGVVIGARSNMNEGGPEERYRNSANFVLIRHSDGSIGSYDHFKQGGVAVRVGDRVERGTLIGYSGNTGFSGGPHLHFFVFRAKDGFTRESFPIKFNTASGVTVPQEGAVNSSPGSSSTEAVETAEQPRTTPGNVTGDLRVCGIVDNSGPRNCKGDYKTTDKIFVYVPIKKPGAYKFRISFTKPFEKSQPVNTEITTEADWGYSYFWITPSEERSPSGTWEATIYVNEHPEGSVRFNAK